MVHTALDPAKGTIVVAAQDLPAGQTVIAARVRARAPQRARHTVQTGPATHVYLEGPANYLSHSCAPNLGLRDNAAGAFDFFTLVPVAAGVEMTFHYAMCETTIATPVACLCRAPTCLGRLAGFWELEPERQLALARLGIAAYLQEWLQRRLAPLPHHSSI
jgi:uncharacterized protein